MLTSCCDNACLSSRVSFTHVMSYHISFKHAHQDRTEITHNTLWFAHSCRLCSHMHTLFQPFSRPLIVSLSTSRHDWLHHLISHVTNHNIIHAHTVTQFLSIQLLVGRERQLFTSPHLKPLADHLTQPKGTMAAYYYKPEGAALARNKWFPHNLVKNCDFIRLHKV